MRRLGEATANTANLTKKEGDALFFSLRTSWQQYGVFDLFRRPTVLVIRKTGLNRSKGEEPAFFYEGIDSRMNSFTVSIKEE